MKKLIAIVTLVITLVILAVPAYAYVYTSYPEAEQVFFGYLSGQMRSYSGKNVGSNERDSECEVRGAYFAQTLRKDAFIGSTQVGNAFNFQVNQGGTWCSRWVDANPNMNGSFAFCYDARNNVWTPGNPNTAANIKTWATFLAEH
jgi:hypothetical protein